MTHLWPNRKKLLTSELNRLCNMVSSGHRLDEPYLSSRVFSIADKFVKNRRPEKPFTPESRIALVIPYHPLDEIGGLEIGTRMIAKGLHQLGHKVEIISRGLYSSRDWSGNRLTPEGITVHGVGLGIEDINKFLFRNLLDYDVIQWMEIFPPIPENPWQYNDKAEQQYLASVLLRASGKRTYLYTATSGNVEKRGTNNPNWAETRRCQPFNALIPVAFTGVNYANPEIKNEYSAAGVDLKFLGQKFIPFGVDTDTFCPVIDNAEKEKLKEEFGLPADKIIFIYFGRFVKRKRPDLLLDVWKHLPDDVHQKAFLLFAGGKAGEGQPDSIYEKMVKNIPETVSTGIIDYVPHEQAPSLLKACDVFVFPTVREGWPLALLEAMSCGISTISSDIDGIRMIVRNGFNGTLITPDSKKELSETLIDATQRPNDYRKIGLVARASVELKYDWEKISSMYRDFYFTDS